MSFAEVSVVTYLLLVVLAVLVAVLWVLLPFAVFGIKPLMRQVMAEQRRTNELLDRIAAGRGGSTPASAAHAAPSTPPTRAALDRLAAGE